MTTGCAPLELSILLGTKLQDVQYEPQLINDSIVWSASSSG